MLPQIGIESLRELGIDGGKMLDPYCGSGSSFSAGLDLGFSEMHGFDINPLAVLISRAKFTKINLSLLMTCKQRIRNAVYEFVKKEESLAQSTAPDFYNIDFWFSENVLKNLSIIKHFIDKIKNKGVRRIFLISFSETVRECSYTRNHEFKLYRMKSEDVLCFNPDVLAVYFDKLNKAIEIYEKHYFPRLDTAEVNIGFTTFQPKENYYDVVLTSPPYGDSKTTVAYGQFSMFANAWLGFEYARKIDEMLMGGKTAKVLYTKGVITESINAVAEASHSRALQVSAFYRDLEQSVALVAKSVKKGGKAIYVVGNRRAKNIQLPTDQFIAEKFEENGFRHLFTYQRALSNKSMPLKNSPTNQKNQRASTMTHEYIVACEK